MRSLPSWVREANELPLGSAQVREDPLQDLELVRGLDRPARALLVASGGCTAALLACQSQLRGLDLVDPNPAQLALTRLKLRLLREPVPERMQLLGHAPLPLEARAERLAALLQELSLPAQSLGPLETVARLGPDYAGRTERLFAALRARLRDQQFDLRELVGLRAPAEQLRRIRPGTLLGQGLARACEEVFALPNLEALFGVAATRNRVQPFEQHFAERLRHVLGSLPAAGNPWLWQLLIGRYPPGVPAPWLEQPPREQLPPLRCLHTSLEDALEGEEGPWELIDLSDVLDWQEPDQARETLARARARLAPGGVLVVRQLNSAHDVPALSEGIAWDEEYAARLHEEDRSYFYRALHVGRAG